MAFLFLRPILFDQVAISEPTPIAVISFTNQTGDGSYDYLQEAIPNLLITSLEQSPYLRVATWERMQDVLAQMGRPSTDVIDRDLGFEVCRHEGIHTIVLGSFVKAGEVFATDVKVLDVDSKTLLKSASARGRGVGSILETQIDELSREIFRATGLSERRIAATQPPIADVTTSSMEAYDHFLKGRKALQQFYNTEAQRHLNKAIAIDSTFAVAHLCLAITYGGLYDQRAEARAYRKAMALADRASEKERLYIEALFAWEIERDSEKQFRTLDKLVAKYPQNKQAHLFLGRYYDREERYPEAIRSFQEALKLDPDYGVALNHVAYIYASMDSLEAAIRWIERYAAVAPEDANAYDSMGDFYCSLGRFDESVAAYREALDIKPDFRSSARNLAYIAMLREKYDEAGHWLERFATMTPGAGMIAEGVWSTAVLHFLLARYDVALGQSMQAEQLSESVDFVLGKQFSLWLRSWVYYEQGELELSRETNDEWVAYGLQHYPQTTLYPALHAYRAGLIDLREGRPEAVQARLVEIEELADRAESDRAREFYRYRRGLLEAELLMAQDSLDAALTIARELAPLEIRLRNTQIDLLANSWVAEDVLGRIYAAQGALDEALAEYELLTASDPIRRGRRFVHPLYHYRLASLYEEQGSQPAARREYEKFLDIWKDADEGRAEVDDARARLATLQGGSR